MYIVLKANQTNKRHRPADQQAWWRSRGTRTERTTFSFHYPRIWSFINMDQQNRHICPRAWLKGLSRWSSFHLLERRRGNIFACILRLPFPHAYVDWKYAEIQTFRFILSPLHSFFAKFRITKKIKTTAKILFRDWMLGRRRTRVTDSHLYLSYIFFLFLARAWFINRNHTLWKRGAV